MNDAVVNEVPVFPLPNVVLFPHSKLPLHIYEARYREMIHDALQTNGPIGLAKLRKQGVDENGRPDFEATFGLGRIVEHELLPGGRYNILVVGIDRAQVLEEVVPDDILYRRVVAEIIQDQVVSDDICRATVDTMKQTLASLESHQPTVCKFLRKRMSRAQSYGELADRVANAVFPEPAARQRLLEEVSVEARLGVCLERVVDILASSVGTQSGSPRN